ncbi:MAG: ATP synthase F1 subunit delta [Thermoguttaceae bacterium]|jgi:F-type H+-transporting ATPase subunit delta
MAESRDITAEHAQTAARIQSDVSVEHIAEVYARAFLDAAESAGQTNVLLAEFDSLVADLLDRNPKFEAVICSTMISHDEIAGVLDRVLGGRVSPLLLNFLKVLSRHRRLECLRQIHRRLHVLYDVLQNRVRVRLTTAEPLSAELASRIRIALRGKFEGEPVLELAVDPKLIGGAVLRLSDTVYDSSIANQLQILRQQMMDRSAHEIQSRRNRFRNPAGN